MKTKYTHTHKHSYACSCMYNTHIKKRNTHIKRLFANVECILDWNDAQNYSCLCKHICVRENVSMFSEWIELKRSCSNSLSIRF